MRLKTPVWLRLGRVRENSTRPFRATHFLDGATVGLPSNDKGKPAINAKGQLTIRLQGIDAPELHYQPSALEAAEFPGLDKAGFAAKKKQYHDAKVVHSYRQLLGATTSKALHDFLAGSGNLALPCRVFTHVDVPNDVFDKYGRMVADIEVTIGGTTTNINQWTVRSGAKLSRLLFIDVGRGDQHLAHPSRSRRSPKSSACASVR